MSVRVLKPDDFCSQDQTMISIAFSLLNPILSVSLEDRISRFSRGLREASCVINLPKDPQMFETMIVK